MGNYNRLKIRLSSSTPFIKSTTHGSFFDEMIRIGCPCYLLGPSENELQHGSATPFCIECEKGYVQKRIANFEALGIHGESIASVTEKFVTDIYQKCGHGYFISVGTSSHLYGLVKNNETVTFEPRER